MAKSSRRGTRKHKDVRNEDRSGNVYENKGSTDTMTENYSDFCAGLASFLQKWTAIQRSFCRKCTGNAVIGARPGPESGRRLIGPSAYRSVD